METADGVHSEDLPRLELETVDRFNRDGFALIRNVLRPDQVSEALAASQAVLSHPGYRETHNVSNHLTAARMFETARVFEELVDVEPVASLVERILGDDCHLIAQNVMRNRPHEIPFSDAFHIDEPLLFALPDEIDRHDDRIALPTFGVVVHFPLCDVPTLDYGPTSYVPGSHRSGRRPGGEAAPTWDGRGPVAILANAGDAYLHNGQCWHRAERNVSTIPRFLLSNAYGARWVAQRFFPYVNYQLPSEVVARSGARRRRFLGMHEKGAFS